MNRSEYPSVTEILSTYEDWSNIPEGVLEVAAKRGTAVHNSCFAYTQGSFLLPSKYEQYPHVASFVRWFDEYVDKVILAEQRLYDDTYRFSGRPDLICVLRGETLPIVVDYKSPVTEGKTWRLQLAGYQRLAKDHNVCRGMALKLSPEGKPAKAIPYESAQDMAIFLQMVGIHHYLRRR